MATRKKKNIPDAPEGTEIKPRKGWYRHTPPYLRPKPVEPKESITDVIATELGGFTMYYDCPVPLTDLPIPEGVDWSSLYLTLKVDRDYDGSSDYELVLEKREESIIPNSHHKREMKAYERDLAKWSEEALAHAPEHAEWKAWVRQEEGKELAAQIKSAESFLRKHGRKVEGK